MRIILKIIAASFVLALILAVAVLSFLSCIAGAFCWLACTAFVLLAVCVLFAGLKTGCIAMLVCTCQEKVDTKKGKITGSPVRSCTELGFCSPRQQPDGDD